MSSIKKWEIWQKFRDFGLFLYNRKEGTFLGRKPSFWGTYRTCPSLSPLITSVIFPGKMLAFYLFFTSIIFSIFYITLGFTNETLKSSYPNSPMFDKYDLLPDPSPGESRKPYIFIENSHQQIDFSSHLQTSPSSVKPKSTLFGQTNFLVYLLFKIEIKPILGLSLYPTLTAHRTPLIWYGTFLSGFNKHTKEKYHISEYTDFVHAIDEFLQRKY